MIFLAEDEFQQTTLVNWLTRFPRSIGQFFLVIFQIDKSRALNTTWYTAKAGIHHFGR